MTDDALREEWRLDHAARLAEVANDAAEELGGAVAVSLLMDCAGRLAERSAMDPLELARLFSAVLVKLTLEQGARDGGGHG
jgi:hypothetical protein